MPFQDKSLQRFKRGEVPCCQTSPDSKNLSKLAFICDKNGAPVVELLVLVFWRMPIDLHSVTSGPTEGCCELMQPSRSLFLTVWSDICARVACWRDSCSV